MVSETKNITTFTKWYNSYQKTNRFTEDTHILKLKREDNSMTVAEFQGLLGWKTENIEILKWLSITGNTLAHKQAAKGWTTTNIEILKLENKHKTLVIEVQIKNGWPTSDTKLLKLKNKSGVTINQLIIDYNIINRPQKLSLKELKNNIVYFRHVHKQFEGKSPQYIYKHYLKLSI